MKQGEWAAECAAVNDLAEFCGARDVPELTPEALEARYGFRRADAMALFGGSILAGVDVLAAAMRAGVAKRYGIVGGEGHTTQALRDRVHGLYPDLDVRGMPEARLFAEVLKRRHGLEPDFLEEKSTNCGNNITYLLEVLREGGAPCRSIVLAQDATMQRRMAAGLALHAPEVVPVSFATYRVRAVPRGGAMGFEPEPEGMWDAARYVSLLMGEIPRLRDDADGYGPRGKGFIAHVDVPEAALAAYEWLKARHPGATRTADARYATRDAARQPGE